jgi:hypothetical protein
MFKIFLLQQKGALIQEGLRTFFVEFIEITEQDNLVKGSNYLY